jgi:hypothetical protein
MHGTRVAVNQGVIFPTPVLPHAAVTPITVGDLTAPGTQEALNLFIRERLAEESGSKIEITLLYFRVREGTGRAGKREESQGAEAPVDEAATAEAPGPLFLRVHMHPFSFSRRDPTASKKVGVLPLTVDKGGVKGVG